MRNDGIRQRSYQKDRSHIVKFRFTRERGLRVNKPRSPKHAYCPYSEITRRSCYISHVSCEDLKSIGLSSAIQSQDVLRNNCIQLLFEIAFKTEEEEHFIPCEERSHHNCIEKRIKQRRFPSLKTIVTDCNLNPPSQCLRE